MALRLRRGTDAERQLITPVEGELIYVTDTKELYAGDGNTVGGVRVTGEIADTINGLTDVDAGVPQDNDILLYSDITTKWESSPLSLRTLPDVEAGAILDGQILAWNAGISAFVPANNVGGGDTTFDGDLVGSVFADDSILVIDGLTGFIYGTHFGSVNNSITGVEIIDAINNVLKGELIGNVNGNLRGDIVGSVFADDSSIIVDSVNNRVTTDTLTANFIKSGLGTLNVSQETDGQITQIEVESVSEQGALTLKRKAYTDISSDNNLIYGGIYFQRDDIGGDVATAIMLGYSDKLVWAVDEAGAPLQAQHMVFDAQGRLGVGNWAPTEKLVVEGNATVSGFVQFGSLNSTERDALTAANGMVIYNTTNNKFEGYQNGDWINLDDGLAAS